MTVSEKAVRLGFLGPGWWATVNHLPVLAKRDDVVLAAVCRRGKEELQRVKNTFNIPFATSDYGEFLEQDLDGVVITTPQELRYEHARAALERGLHVMIEKPMTLRADQAWELVRLARKRGLHLLVPNGWHYKPFVSEAKRRMDAGVVGSIHHVLCHMASPLSGMYSGTGFEIQTNLFAPDLGMYSQQARGGGHALGSLTHSLPMMFWLTALLPSEVAAFMSMAGAEEVDMHNAIAVRFREGAIGVVSGSSSVPAKCRFQVDLRIYGEEGMLLLDVERERMEVRRHDGDDFTMPVAPREGEYSCEGPPNRFVDLILGKPVANDSSGEHAALTIAFIEAAFNSFAAGRAAPVEVEMAEAASRDIR